MKKIEKEFFRNVIWSINYNLARPYNKICVVIIITGVLFVNSFSVYGQFAGGDGSAGNPYQIVEREHLEELRNYLGGAYENTHYLMMNDIDLSGQDWVPIGAYSVNSSMVFRGKLHGNNKKISGIRIIQNGNGNFHCSGLFGCLYDGAYIDSLHLEGGEIVGYDQSQPGYAGALAAYIKCSENQDSVFIIGCSSSVRIVGARGNRSYTGGLIGYSDRYVLIKDCINYGNIDGGSGHESTVGGILGYGRNLNIESCINEGSVEEAYNAGGIIGAGNPLYLELCSNRGIISGNRNAGGIIGEGVPVYVNRCENFGTVSGPYTSGGIIGYSLKLTNSDTVRITKCVNHGEIKNSESAGGIVGFVVKVIINQCINFGQIVNSLHIGGIVGLCSAYYIEINDVYNYSDITTNVDVANVGGIVGVFQTHARALDPVAVLNNSYSFGLLNASGDYVKVGGIIGQIYCNAGDIVVQNCVAVEKELNATGEFSTANRIVGRIGSCYTNILFNNYADENLLVNGEVVSLDIGSGTIQGENRFLESFYEYSTYSSTLSDWDYTNVWDIRPDNINLPYFKWQSAPAHIEELYLFDITLNMYHNSDSLSISYAPGFVYDTIMYNLNSGIDSYDINLDYRDVGDTLFFVNFEPNLYRSYPVSKEIQKKEIIIQADNFFKCFGENEDPEFTYTVTPELAGDMQLNGSLVREAGNSVGEYNINQGSITNENNPAYEITFISGKLEIKELPIISEVQDVVICSGYPIQIIDFTSENMDNNVIYEWNLLSGDITQLPSNGIGSFPSEFLTNLTTQPISSLYEVTAVYYDGSLRCEGNSDAFTITVNPIIFNEIEEVSCGVYLAPDGAEYSTSGTYTAIVNNEFGCDSLITINLTIHPIPELVNDFQNMSFNHGDIFPGIQLLGSVSGTTFMWEGGRPIGLYNGWNAEAIPSFTVQSNSSITSTISITPMYMVGTEICLGTTKSFDISVTNQTMNSSNIDEDYNDGIYDYEYEMVEADETELSIPLVSTEVYLYPNPTQGQITIDLGEINKSIIISVYNTAGQILSEDKFVAQKMVDLNIFGPTGIYLVRVNADKKEYIFRVVKE